MSVAAQSHGPVHDRVLVWLEENPVPPGPSDELRDWRSRAAELGTAAVPALVDLLGEGSPYIQYGALGALGQLGVEARHGYEPNLHYEVQVPGQELLVVVPKHQVPLSR